MKSASALRRGPDLAPFGFQEPCFGAEFFKHVRRSCDCPARASVDGRRPDVIEQLDPEQRFIAAISREKHEHANFVVFDPEQRSGLHRRISVRSTQQVGICLRNPQLNQVPVEFFAHLNPCRNEWEQTPGRSPRPLDDWNESVPAERAKNPPNNRGQPDLADGRRAACYHAPNN